MRHTTKIQSLAMSNSAEHTGRLPSQAPTCRVFTFRGGDPLCFPSGDLTGDDPGTSTGNSGEGTGYNDPDQP